MNIFNRPYSFIKLLALACAALMISACGGGGGGGDGATVPWLTRGVAYVKAFNTGYGDNLGQAVALSADGNTMAISAYNEASSATGIDGNINDNNSSMAGAVYLYLRNPATGAWAREAYVKASNTEHFAQFGYSLSLAADGNTLAVGAIGEASAATGINGSQANGAANSGAVYVFARSAGVWSQQAYVKASNTNFDDRFGWSVSLSADGNTLAVGTLSEDSADTGIGGAGTSNSAQESGAAYVFTRSGTNWSQQAYVKASNTQAGDYFGYSVSLSGDGDTLAIGARHEDSNGSGVNPATQANNDALSSGAVYLFHRVGGFWSQQAYVKAFVAAPSMEFGYSVSLSFDGNTLTVGAPGEQGGGSGVNSNQEDFPYVNYSGAVYTYTRTGTAWAKGDYLKASHPRENDRFGEAVVLTGDGSTLAVGAPYQQSNATGINGDETNASMSTAGAAYLFRRSGPTWEQRAFVKASNTGASDYFGTSVALSAEGDLAVGAPNEDSGAVGIGGDQGNDSAGDAGAVYLY